MSHTNDPFPQSPTGNYGERKNNIAALIRRMNQHTGYQSGDFFGPKVRVEGVPNPGAFDALDPNGALVPPYRPDVLRKP